MSEEVTCECIAGIHDLGGGRFWLADLATGGCLLSDYYTRFGGNVLMLRDSTYDAVSIPLVH
jgi:hypothetical protein